MEKYKLILRSYPVDGFLNNDSLVWLYFSRHTYITGCDVIADLVCR